MRILIVAATATEIDPIVAPLEPAGSLSAPTRRYTRGSHQIDVLVTGVGMVATAAWCARALALTDYDVALNFGVCGSFDRALALGSVVHVTSDFMPELGAEDDEAFLTIDELTLVGSDEPPYTNGRLVNAAPPASRVLSTLPAVSGITVNTVHGNARSIDAVRQRFAPQVESMEGAAFMYACLVRTIRFAQVRAVSNVVEKRQRGAWKIPEAIAALGAAASGILDTL